MPQPHPAPTADPAGGPIWLPGFLHELRAHAALLGGLAQCLEAPADPRGISLLAARAELLRVQADALDLAERAIPGRQQSLDAILEAVRGGLKKFLSRGHIDLKFVGETPDGESDARFLRGLLECLLVTMVNARSEPGPGWVEIRTSAWAGGYRLRVRPMGAWGTAVRAQVEDLPRASSIEGHAVRRALDVLPGTLRTEPHDRLWQVVLELGSPEAP